MENSMSKKQLLGKVVSIDLEVAMPFDTDPSEVHDKIANFLKANQLEDVSSYQDYIDKTDIYRDDLEDINLASSKNEVDSLISEKSKEEIRQRVEQYYSSFFTECQVPTILVELTVEELLETSDVSEDGVGYNDSDIRLSCQRTLLNFW